MLNYTKLSENSPGINEWCKKINTSLVRLVLLFVTIVSTQLATSQTITVDGDPSDWPAVLKRTDIPKTFRHDANNTNDDQWTGGSQDEDMVNTWYWIKGNTNDKGDITNAGAVLIGTRIYFFGDRTAVQGNAQIGFWFFLGGIAPTGTGLVQSGFTGQNRDGDILAISNFTNGGGAAAPTIYRRQGTTLVEDETITAFVMTNKDKAMQYVPPGVTTADPTWPFTESWTFTPKSDGSAGEYPDPLFFEGYIDFGNVRDANLCFTNFLLETRNSHSLDASLQDFVAGNFDVTPRPSLDLDPICEGDDIVITASVVGGLSPLEYSWKVGNNPYGAFGQSNTLTLQDVPYSMNGTPVSVKVKGANGCISDAVTVELVVNNIPDIETSDADVCEDAATEAALVNLVSLVSNPEGGTLSFYTSEANAKAKANAINLNANNEVSAPIGITRYWVRSEATGSCYSVDYIDVKVTDNPDITTTDATVCETDARGVALVNIFNLVSNPDGGILSFYLSEEGAKTKSDFAHVTPNSNVEAPIGETTRYWVRSEASGTSCYSIDYIDITVTDNPDISASNKTICEGESIDLTTLVDGDGGTVTFHLSQAAADAGTGALDPTTVSPAKGIHEYFVRSTSKDNTDCYATTKLTVTVNACSKIKLEKQTNGVVDQTKTWSFTISGGDLVSPITRSVENDADGILFDDLTLSKAQTYTICETNVPAGYTVTIQYWDGDSWENVPVYDPNAINGGGDFGQGEAYGNYCFKIGTAGIALPPNIWGSENVVALQIKINNIQPPGGNARTPGYWKNWNNCSNGNQSQTAARNGGKDAGFWLMTDHLPHTMWSTASSSFIIESCEQGVAILDERQYGGKGTKLASDAGYKLAKHLFAYQLNKKSGTYNCESAAQTAVLAEALLAKYNFNGTGAKYLSNKDKAVALDYNLALQYAKVLDAYNNNLPCAGSNLRSTTKVAMAGAVDQAPVTELKVSASPNPYFDKVRFVIESPVSGHGNLEVFNMLGQKVKTVYEGHVNAGRGQVIEFSVPQTLRSNLIYVMRVGNYRVTGKLVRSQQ